MKTDSVSPSLQMRRKLAKKKVSPTPGRKTRPFHSTSSLCSSSQISKMSLSLRNSPPLELSQVDLPPWFLEHNFQVFLIFFVTIYKGAQWGINENVDFVNATSMHYVSQFKATGTAALPGVLSMAYFVHSAVCTLRRFKYAAHCLTYFQWRTTKTKRTMLVTSASLTSLFLSPILPLALFFTFPTPDGKDASAICSSRYHQYTLGYSNLS